MFCGAIAVFVGVGSLLSRWFRKRRGRFRVFCFPTKETNHGKRLMNGIFKRLLNVKGMVVGSARIVDGPLRPEPVPEVHARREGGAALLALRAEATWS